jgi:hypothetical protein
MQLEFKSVQDEDTFNRGGGGSGSEIPKEKFNTISDYVVNNWDSASALTTKAKPGYKFKWDSGTLNVYKEESDGRGGKDLVLVGPITSPVEIGQYIGIKNEQTDDWKDAVERARGKKPATPKPKTKTTTKTVKFNG